MKRPEKKDLYYGGLPSHRSKIDKEFISLGYNQACDDWEKHLPSEEEIEKIIRFQCFEIGDISRRLAKAIHKRIRGE